MARRKRRKVRRAKRRKTGRRKARRSKGKIPLSILERRLSKLAKVVRGRRGKVRC